MRTTKTIALVLAAIMLAAALSACSVNNPNYTVLKVGDMNIGVNAYYNNYNYLAQVYSMYGLYNVSTPEAFKRMQDQVFNNLINNALPVVVAKQNGVTLTEEEEAQVQADFKEQIDQMIAQYASQVDESITDEDAKYAEEEKLFKAALKSSGWNYNTYLKMIEDDVRGAAIGNKYMESLYSGVNVTEEDAKAYYDEQLAAEKQRTERVTKRILTEEEMSALSDRLMQVTKGMTITVQYFKEDTAHPEVPAVGNYITLTGKADRIDPVFRTLQVGDTVVPFEDLVEVSGEGIMDIDAYLGIGEE